jgi:hypothetical protein
MDGYRSLIEVLYLLSEEESDKRCVIVMADEITLHGDQIILHGCLKEFCQGNIRGSVLEA